MSIVYTEWRDTRGIVLNTSPCINVNEILTTNREKKMYYTFVSSTHVHRDNGFCEVGQQKLTGEMHIVEEL